MQNIDWSRVFLYMGEIVGFLLLLISPYLLALFFNWLGKKDLFFTIVKEGQAKAVLVNGQFKKALMSYRGHRFRRGTEPADPKQDTLYDPSDPDGTYWDIIRGKEWRDEFLNRIPILRDMFVGGLRWTGIPPFALLHRYRFEWITLEHERSDDGKKIKSPELVPTPHKEDETAIIVLQVFTYFAQVRSAETKADTTIPKTDTATETPVSKELGIPVDADLLLLVTIVNPFKALFRVTHWLQTVTNDVVTATRVFIGSKEITELSRDTGATGTQLTKFLKPLLDRFIKEFGVHVTAVRIQSVQPAGQNKDEYQKQTTAAYTAAQKAKARIVEANAEERFLRATVGTVAGIEGGTEAFKWQQIGKSNLGTYVEGGAKEVGVNVGVGGKSTTATSPTTPTPTEPSASPPSTTDTP